MTPAQIYTAVLMATLTALLLLPSPTLAGKNRHDEEELHLSSSSTNQDNDDEAKVKVEPEETTLSTGKDTQFKCTAAHTANSTGGKEESMVYWINANGSHIQDLNDTRFQVSADGWLNISSLEVKDSGDYTCFFTEEDGGVGHHHNNNATARLNVYEMPDYFLASMIVVAVNVALAILFFSCLIYKTIQSRRETARYKKYKEANVEVTVSEGQPPIYKAHNKHLDI